MARLEKVIGRHEPRPHVSHETYLFMRAEIERLSAELRWMTGDRDHWYMKANYSPEEIAEFRRRLSMGLDDEGNWLWPDRMRLPSGEIVPR